MKKAIAKKIATVDTDDVFRKAKNGVLLAGASAIVFFSTRHFINKARQNKVLNLLEKDKEAQQATLIRSALNPSGNSWLMWGDGTLEDKLFSVASQIENINKVAQYYRKLYNSNMMLDIQNELESSEYTQFLNLISKTGQGYQNNAQNVLSTNKSRFIVSKVNELNIYKSKSSFNMPFQSIYKIGYNETLIGKTTGRILKLSFLGNSFRVWNAMELEVRVYTKRPLSKDSYTKKIVYINADEVKLITGEEFKNGVRSNQYKARYLTNEEF